LAACYGDKDGRHRGVDGRIGCIPVIPGDYADGARGADEKRVGSNAKAVIGFER